MFGPMNVNKNMIYINRVLLKFWKWKCTSLFKVKLETYILYIYIVWVK